MPENLTEREQAIVERRRIAIQSFVSTAPGVALAAQQYAKDTGELLETVSRLRGALVKIIPLAMKGRYPVSVAFEIKGEISEAKKLLADAALQQEGEQPHE